MLYQAGHDVSYAGRRLGACCIDNALREIWVEAMCLWGDHGLVPRYGIGIALVLISRSVICTGFRMFLLWPQGKRFLHFWHVGISLRCRE